MILKHLGVCCALSKCFGKCEGKKDDLGLEHISHEERLRELDLSNLEKTIERAHH